MNTAKFKLDFSKQLTHPSRTYPFTDTFIQYLHTHKDLTLQADRAASLQRLCVCVLTLLALEAGLQNKSVL